MRRSQLYQRLELYVDYGLAIRALCARLALILLGLLIGLLLLELCLQIAARWAGDRSLPVGLGVLAGRRRVLALGDSNTYGLYVRAERAYPKVLERHWNARHPDRPIEVLNVAFPGTNSSQVRNRFARYLEVFHPDVVLVMVGANDIWTMPEPVADAPPSAGVLLWRYSRVFRIFFMLRRWVQAPELKVRDFKAHTFEGNPAGLTAVEEYGDARFEVGYRRLPSERTVPPPGSTTSTNLRAVCERARRDAVELIFVTYPGLTNSMYVDASRTIRLAGATCGARVIDVEQAFVPACSADACPTLLYGDGHPTARGHALAAKVVGHALSRYWMRPAGSRAAAGA